jgi:hypothetical protein
MSKDKKKIAQRKAAKATKTKRTRPARIARRKDQEVLRMMRRAKVLQAANLMRDGVEVPDITDDDYIFWLCHGANFIVSDEESGEWCPLFEGIYEGVIPEAEAVAQTVLSRYAEEINSEEGLTGIPRSVLAWTVTEKSSVRIYKYEAERRIHEKDPEANAEAQARQPHNPVVWGVMAEVKKRTLTAG